MKDSKAMAKIKAAREEGYAAGTNELTVVLLDELRGAQHPRLANESARCVVEHIREFIKPKTIIPVPMLLWCPECMERHIDRGEFVGKPHHTHACQHCGHCWRPAVVPTVGVQFLPGFKDAT
ncbi:MAG TPA: hypothetical protein VHM19_23315 [Polyangiales bacterium]|jgi:hypothetical protein|nr:hypothetical protein [Polyangiales bacterium]